MRTERRPSRRLFLTGAATTAGALLLSGCDQLSQTPGFRKVLYTGEDMTMLVQRALLSPSSMAKEFPEPRRSRPTSRPTARPTRTTRPIRALAANGFADWRLEVGGLVERPASYSLADLRAMPSRSQITRHDCVEGWSCIGKWTGVQLASVLSAAGLQPKARYILFTCADELEKTLDGSGRYYETIDLEDAFHPQTILAYDMNDQAAADRPRRAAPAPGRAPARLQDGEVRDADRRGRGLRLARTGQRRLLGRPRLRLVRGNLSRQRVLRPCIRRRIGLALPSHRCAGRGPAPREGDDNNGEARGKEGPGPLGRDLDGTDRLGKGASRHDEEQGHRDQGDRLAHAPHREEVGEEARHPRRLRLVRGHARRSRDRGRLQPASQSSACPADPRRGGQGQARALREADLAVGQGGGEAHGRRRAAS